MWKGTLVAPPQKGEFRGESVEGAPCVPRYRCCGQPLGPEEDVLVLVLERVVGREVADLRATPELAQVPFGGGREGAGNLHQEEGDRVELDEESVEVVALVLVNAPLARRVVPLDGAIARCRTEHLARPLLERGAEL